jgi:Mycothiol maleylpyruvate isomerase N-terminal domain
VKDIAAHLLDTQLRRLAIQRDGMSTVPDVPVHGYADLVKYLNRLNAEWVTAARRISPPLLIDLLEHTGRQVSELFARLDPGAPAIFPVAWAGEEQSANWFDIGREYTERWLHQQQIRDAVDAPGLSSREWMHPVLDLFLRALPHRYRDVAAAPDTELHVAIEGPAGGDWTLRRETAEWRLNVGAARSPAARVRMDQDTAWRLFSKGLGPAEARERVTVEGDQALGAGVLGALAVMA